MNVNSQQSNLEVIPTTLMKVVQDTFKKMSSLEFSNEPKFVERTIIEHDSRMRIFGLEKFNGPCYASSISFYKSQRHLETHDSCGTLNLFLEEDAAAKILKALGYKDFSDEDEALILDHCAEFCNVIAESFKNELNNLNHGELLLSTPVKEKNDIKGGVEFPYSQTKYFETKFYLWKQKAVVIDIVMTPSDSKGKS